ncbi:hypothetical protein RJ640_010852, partial [Escallonia rubra]
MAIVTGDRYLESLVKFVEKQAGPLIEGTLSLKLNPVGLHYVQSRLEALAELETLLTGAPVDYLRAYVSDLGDHRALEQLRRILRLLTSLKVVSVLPLPARDPTPLSLLPFGRLKVLELRGCDLSTSAARGLLELRHTLEKIICHNSTDALRHVFASRISEIKHSPQWNRLSFVSCACNVLVLMDESLQLLPVVETLDLSRNKFAKVDNLWKCTKLKHLDIGFNQLRTIASFSEVSSQIVKLVLRNNALTTLRGIENLKSLEGLDLSYNVISNFSELEILGGFPSLQNLWLEGNPLASARWYRPHVFSFFPYPDRLKLDEKNICTREFWKRQLLIASRQKRPASFGFYSPAKDDAELEGSINTKQSVYVCSDQDSVSCDNDVRRKEEKTISDEEVEIVDLMNRIEVMKKERSALWLQEFKEWMNLDSGNIVNNARYSEALSNPDKDSCIKNETRHKHLGESSRYVSDSVQASGDESSTNVVESDNSFADTSTGFSAQKYFDRIGDAASKLFAGPSGGDPVPAIGRYDSNQEHLKPHYYDKAHSMKATSSDSFRIAEDDRMSAKNGVTQLAAIDDIIGSNSSSVCPGSPPHYQEDILHRRHNLEEEFLQLSAESYSVASSDSNTSYSEEESAELGTFIPQDDQSVIDDLSERSGGESSVNRSRTYDKTNDALLLTRNGERASAMMELGESDIPQLHRDSSAAYMHKGADCIDQNNGKRKLKKRVISLSAETAVNDETEPSHMLNGSLE